jgi:hypothetical protein
MESLIDDISFAECSTDIDGILSECKVDYESTGANVFVGISLAECEEGLQIRARHSCKTDEQLMIALQGAINLYFSKHPQEDDT